MELTLIGLGVAESDISLSAYNCLCTAKTIVLRTENTLSAQFLRKNGLQYVALDSVYNTSRSFDTLNKNLAKQVEKHLKTSDVCYLVDGAVSQDNSCRILLKKHKNAKVFEGVSKSGSAQARAGVFGTATSVSAYDVSADFVPSFPLVVFDLDSVFMASECKLLLSDYVGDECDVTLIFANKTVNTKLFEIDRFSGYDYQTALVIKSVPLLEKQRFNYDDLHQIIKLLRAPNGCPWDRQQTKESIRKNLIEECYELAHAIDMDNDDMMLEEVGDVILQAVFHIVFAEERCAFNGADVFTDECKKLIFRHSHIFGTDKATSVEGALDVWDKNKQVEKGFNTPSDYVLDVPKSFPSLLRAQKTIKRIEKYSVDKPQMQELIDFAKFALDKIGGQSSDKKSAFGGLLLAVCYMLKKCEQDAEETLYFAIQNMLNAFSADDKSFSFEKFLQGLMG